MPRLVDLIVGIVVLVLTAGLLMAAIGKIREGGERMKCENNMKQLCLAAQTYSSTYRTFPPAGLPNPALPPEKRLSWQYALVPYVESVCFYDPHNDGEGWESLDNRHRAIAGYFFCSCPAFVNSSPKSVFAFTNYIGILGLGKDAGLVSVNDPRRGAFSFNNDLNLKDLEGRINNLLLVLETTRVEGAWTAAGYPTSRGIEENGTPLLGKDGQFGGIHADGVNAGFANGSVRLLSYTIDPGVLRAIATVQGCKEVSPLNPD